MAITKILNIMESEGRNPASHLKNALEYIQNPDKTEECVLVGGINCLPDTAFEQMEETKNIFHAKLIVSDVKKALVSSANLSYHGMQGNVEMGFLIESHDKAKQIEEVMKEMVRMKVFSKLRE